MKIRIICTARKISKYKIISGPYFPAFRVNIQSECGKIRIKNKSVFGHLSCSAAMLDGRFHLNSSPMGTILNLLSTISFSDSVDELNDELDEDEDEEGNLFFFSHLDLAFFRLFLLERFTIYGLDEGELIFLFLVLCRLSCFLVEEVSRFSDTLFAGS